MIWLKGSLDNNNDHMERITHWMLAFKIIHNIFNAANLKSIFFIDDTPTLGTQHYSAAYSCARFINLWAMVKKKNHCSQQTHMALHQLSVL